MSSRSFKSASTDIELRFVLAISISWKKVNIAGWLEISNNAFTRRRRIEVQLLGKRTSLPACLTILNVIGDLLADGCQIEELLLDEGIFSRFGKFPIHGRLLPKIFIPVHASSCPAGP